MSGQCIQTQEWIEEEISKPIEEWVEKSEQRCKKRPWWHPLRWLCWIVTTFVKVVTWVAVKVAKLVVRTICRVVAILIETITGVLSGLWDVLAGLFTLDFGRVLNGLINIGLSGLAGAAGLLQIVFLVDALRFILEERRRGQLEAYVRLKLSFKYGGEELQSIYRSLRIDHGAFGYRMPMRAIRTFLDSERPSDDEEGVPNLVRLNEQELINLRELCGFEFNERWHNRKRYKTLKKGLVASGGGGGEVNNPISKDELETYLSSRGTAGPRFVVLCMRDGVLETKLGTAEHKARELGLMPSWSRETREVWRPEHINHNESGNRLASFLIDPIGRTDKTMDDNAAKAELCTPVAVGVFRYKGTRRGIGACLRGSPSGQNPHASSGVSFIDNQPDIYRKYVLIHELGHYFGLSHVDGLNRIMCPATDWSWLSLRTLWLLLTAEPYFTLEEAMQTWDYIIEHFPAKCLGGNEEGGVIL